MPTYDYVCDRCNHEFEQFQSITAEPVRKCPSCGKNALRRRIGPGGGIIFRGNGFYQTDYRSESYKKAAEAEKPAASSGKSEPGSTKPSIEKSAATDATRSDSPSAPKPGGNSEKPNKAGSRCT